MQENEAIKISFIMYSFSPYIYRTNKNKCQPLNAATTIIFAYKRSGIFV